MFAIFVLVLIFAGAYSQLVCNETCHFTYDGSLSEFNKRCTQSLFGDVIITDRALLQGDGYLAFPMFHSNTLQPEFSLTFTFKYTGNRINEPIKLISNGCNNLDPSIEFSFMTDRWNTETTLMLWVTDEVMSKILTFKNPSVDVRNDVSVKIVQSETAFMLQVAEQQIQKVAKTSSLHIVSVDCPLQIGIANEVNNFVGEFDDLIYYPCDKSEVFSSQDGASTALPIVPVNPRYTEPVESFYTSETNPPAPAATNSPNPWQRRSEQIIKSSSRNIPRWYSHVPQTMSNLRRPSQSARSAFESLFEPPQASASASQVAAAAAASRAVASGPD